MSARKWQNIVVEFDDGKYVSLNRTDFEKMEEIAPILDALQRVKRMQHDVNRLLGEAEG